jgi:hypothetical protein
MKKLQILIGLLLIAIIIVLAVSLINANKKIPSQRAQIKGLESKLQSAQSAMTRTYNMNQQLASALTELQNRKEITAKVYLQNNGLHSISRGIAVVVYKPSFSCSYFILQNNYGYIIAEWMGGNDPDLGDQLSGNFNSFGTKDYYNQSKDTDSRLWIDNYMLSKDNAFESIGEKCN